jgi:hypothetical protein
MKAISAVSELMSAKTNVFTPQSIKPFIMENPSVALERLSANILNGKALSPQELLGYQMVAHRFSLSMEVASKVADGVAQSVRKLQSPQ